MDKSSDGLPISTRHSSSTSADSRTRETEYTEPDDSLLPSLQTGPGTTTPPWTTGQDLSIPGSDSFSQECTSDLGRGVKRKFDEYENEAHIRTQQKRRQTHTVYSRGVKRKSASDHSEQLRKRFKATPRESGVEEPDIEEPSLSNTSGDGNNSFPNIDSSAADSDSAETGDISNSLPAVGFSKDIPEEDSRDAQREQSDDGNSCPRSCVCNLGHSRLPEPIEREFATATPLYRSLLMRRLYNLSNTQYMCCKRRCVRKYPRESVMRISLRHVTEDYYESDLRVTRYSWGEWKE